MQAVILATNLFAEDKARNSWIDIPIVESIEYFTTLMAQALIWARKYAILFGLIGIIWSGLKVMLSRMAVKQMFYDTLFKWVGFAILVALYPMIVYGFLGLANEIGENVGLGKTMVEQEMKKLKKLNPLSEKKR